MSNKEKKRPRMSSAQRQDDLTPSSQAARARDRWMRRRSLKSRFRLLTTGDQGEDILCQLPELPTSLLVISNLTIWITLRRNGVITISAVRRNTTTGAVIKNFKRESVPLNLRKTWGASDFMGSVIELRHRWRLVIVLSNLCDNLFYIYKKSLTRNTTTPVIALGLTSITYLIFVILVRRRII